MKYLWENIDVKFFKAENDTNVKAQIKCEPLFSMADKEFRERFIDGTPEDENNKT